MALRLCVLMGLFAVALFADPFYYGDEMNMESQSAQHQSLKLYGILHHKANINGSWVALHSHFTHKNKDFKLLKIQDSCVLIVEFQTPQSAQKLCYKKPVLMQGL